MRITRSIDIGGRSVAVRELTVGEIRQWIASLEGQIAAGDIVGLHLLAEVSLDDLPWMCDLTKADIEQMAPSELRAVIEAAKEVNADFFVMRGRLEMAGRQAQASAGSWSPPSAP